MIKAELTETYGWESAIRGMRNPLNSWDKIDSKFDGFGEADGYSIGENDFALMMKLVRAGSDHRKFMRQIFVSVDITAPRYWWSEFDTYKVGTVANSTSTMHTIHKKEITLDDFSTEKICTPYGMAVLDVAINALNSARESYIETGDKKYWDELIQLLPASYNQKRTVTLNYEVLRNMYHARKNHKLSEWHQLCRWIETLPYSRLIIEVARG